MFAVPGSCWAAATSRAPTSSGSLSWILGIPGLVLSLWTGIAYIPKVRDGLRAVRDDSFPPAD